MQVTFTEIPASNNYPGMTTGTINGRVIKCVGTGDAVRRAIEEHALRSRKEAVEE